MRAPTLSIILVLTTAVTALAGDTIYVAEYKFNAPILTAMDTSGAVTTPLSVIPSGDWLPVGLAVDANAGKAYWTHGSFNQGAIRRANLDGTQVETIISGLTNPRGLALDASSGYVYWSDTQDRTIYRVRFDGSGFQTVANTGNQLGRPTLDLANGHFYYGDLAAGTIRRANLDGTGQQIIVSGGDDPIAVDLDLDAGKIYWVDAQTITNHVARANLDGTGVEVLVQFPLASSGLTDIAVDAAGGRLFFADEITASEKGVWRADLDGSNATRIYVSPSGWNAGAMALVKTACTSPTVSYGAGCPGTGGATPTLSASDCAVIDCPFTLAMTDGLPGATAFLFVGATTASFPLGSGCTFLVSPVLPPLAGFPLDAAGAFTFTVPIPASAPLGATAAIQALVPDAGAALGFSATGGLLVTIE